MSLRGKFIKDQLANFPWQPSNLSLSLLTDNNNTVKTKRKVASPDFLFLIFIGIKFAMTLIIL